MFTKLAFFFLTVNTSKSKIYRYNFITVIFSYLFTFIFR